MAQYGITDSMSDSLLPNSANPDATSVLAERGVIIEGQRIASAMNNPPRALLSRAPLVLLPGVLAPWSTYRNALERLATERRVFALDWPGFGSSAQPDPAEFTYTPAHLAGLLAQWLDALGIARAVLLAGGESASVAIHFAAAHPQRVLGLALVGPRGVATRSVLASALDLPLRSLSLLRVAEGPLTALALGPTTEETQAVEAQFRAERANDSHLAQDARRTRRLATIVALEVALDAAQPEALRLAREIEAPCAVIRGGMDTLCSASEARTVAEALGARGALEVTLPEAGHLPHLQQLERFLQALSGVLGAAEARLAERLRTGQM